jgi:hypothetical protein
MWYSLLLSCFLSFAPKLKILSASCSQMHSILNLCSSHTARDEFQIHKKDRENGSLYISVFKVCYKTREMWYDNLLFRVNLHVYRLRGDRKWTYIQKPLIFYQLLTSTKHILNTLWSRDGAAGKATVYGLNYRGVGVWVPEESRIFVPPSFPDRIWDQSSLRSNGSHGLFPRW